MIRTMAFRVLLFFLPFVLYGLYLFLVRRRLPTLAQTPWTGLFIAGLVLVIISFLYVGLVDNQLHKGVYVPPHAVNGKIVPGHFGNGS